MWGVNHHRSSTGPNLRFKPEIFKLGESKKCQLSLCGLEIRIAFILRRINGVVIIAD